MTTSADAVVIGAGFAGLSAAIRLSDAGRRVVVVDQAPRLGGRATAFDDKESGERVDNGQHVLFGCYRETFAFLKRLGTDELAAPQPRFRLTMADADGQYDLTCPPLPAPYHLVVGLLRWRALGVADRLSALRMSRLLRAVKRHGAETVAERVAPDATVSDWLADHGQTRRLNDCLWHPLAYAALNQAPDEASARPFVRVLGELFGPRPDDAAVALPMVPLDELYARPAVEWLEAAGNRVLLRTAARVDLDESGSVRGVVAGDEEIAAPVVISAVPWYAFSKLWPAGVPDQLLGVAAAAAATAASPIVTVNLWLDQPVFSERFIGLVGGPMHWVFNKSAIYGDATAHLSIVASGARDLVSADNHEVTDRAMAQLRTVLPGARGRKVLRSVVVREHRATFSIAPGQPPRPETTTAVPGFFLAGDWTDTGLPGTIEGAVVSGHRAADTVLR